MTREIDDERSASSSSESGIVLRHAGTVLVGQLSTMAFGVTDTVVAGRYSDASLAALSVGSAVFVSVFVALMGILQALLPVWAELHGARKFIAVGQSFRQALYLCLITMVLGMTALGFPEPLLHWAAVPAGMQAEVTRYLAILALSLPPALLFRMYSTLNQSLGKPALVTWLQIGALCLKVPLSIWFTFGGLGLPAQGAAGCAWATLLVNYGMLAVALALLRTQAVYRTYGLWQRPERPDWSQIAAFARLGVPNGLAIMVEVTSFTLMALFIARQGTVASASHQIASNLAAVLYMVPLSIGIAASARLGYWMGAGDAVRARGAIRIGFRLAISLSVVLSGLVLLGREAIANIYSSQPAVVALTTPLLAWIALYHLADATQAVTAFLLRCFRVTVLPLLIYSVLLWGVGLTGGYLLAYNGISAWPAQQTPSAFWMSSAAALCATALVLIALLWRTVQQRLPLQPADGSPPLRRV
jgi:MATE family multidrug resistance protein